MKLSPNAARALKELIEDLNDGISLFEYDNHGICTRCGNIQSSCEPDAEGYECEECGELAVCGIETALLAL